MLLDTIQGVSIINRLSIPGNRTRNKEVRVGMRHEANYRRNVRYELMLGREATEAIARCPVGYLPIGCLERHGDHLPMGLD